MKNPTKSGVLPERSIPCWHGCWRFAFGSTDNQCEFRGWRWGCCLSSRARAWSQQCLGHLLSRRIGRMTSQSGSLPADQLMLWRTLCHRRAQNWGGTASLGSWRSGGGWKTLGSRSRRLVLWRWLQYGIHNLPDEFLRRIIDVCKCDFRVRLRFSELIVTIYANVSQPRPTLVHGEMEWLSIINTSIENPCTYRETIDVMFVQISHLIGGESVAKVFRKSVDLLFLTEQYRAE